MTAKINDWVLSEEDLRTLLHAVNVAMRFDKAVLEQVFEKFGLEFDSKRVHDLAMEFIGGTDQSPIAQQCATLVDLSALREALQEHRSVAKGELELMEELTRIEIPLSSPESFQRLEMRNAEEWEAVVERREERQADLVKLGAPKLILAEQEKMLLMARAGLAWMRYRAVAEALGGEHTYEAKEDDDS